MKKRGIGFLFILIATVAASLAVNVVVTITVVSRLRLYPQDGRYYLHREETPEITVTSMFDAQTNTQLLYIADDGEGDPSINVLPVTREGISHVSVGPFSEHVMITHSVNDERIMHTVMVSEDNFPSTLSNTDADKDGTTDSRSVGFPTDSGYVGYLDLDANGTLDGYFAVVLNGGAGRTCRILVDQCWIDVEDSAELFASPFTAKTLDTPPATYHFQDGVWRESTEMSAE